jgi:hypothetical protein
MMEERFTTTDGTLLPYGFALVHGDHRALPTRSHAGGDAGFRCFLLRFPEQRLSVAVLANTPMPVSNLAHRTAEAWLEDVLPPESTPEAAEPEATASVGAEGQGEGQGERAEPARVELPLETLERLAGWYELPAAVVVEMAIEDGALRLKLGGRTQATLVPQSPTRFAFEEAGPDAWAEFTLDGDTVTGLTVQRNAAERFELRPMPPPDTEGIDEYVGTYESRELATRYQVLRDGDELVLRRRKYDDVPLAPMGPDRFRGSHQIAFERNAEGEVTGFRISSGRVLNLLFDRRTEGGS